jgi:hemerythrin superfamily protein
MSVVAGSPWHRGEQEDDLVEMVLGDHERARRLMEEFFTLNLEQRREAFPYLVRTLLTHEAAEELVVYPALEECAAGGAAVAGDRLEEQHRAERFIGELEHQSVQSPGFEASFRQLRSTVEDHALAEEQTVLPVLSAQLDGPRRKELGARYRTARERAPTHAHPRAPHLVPVMKTAGVVDRVRDVVTLRNAPRVRRALRTRDLGALLRRPPWQPHRG